ncbi:uncharacterized protein MKK02DRAFT_30891 [Dioszegia hungarica]|uniref:Uncharacterized protein n=1 Tax=Dioszegia hungarica TaxID=4972 RepID=A0AA38H1E2_9TREE|nr:uncharacterized protein MKK02DRAFT_30891 [Dioszegia hungarica]KAI9631912.1 hypothetical protein MKK02DRAFT_30891 [Dioszegia hungarica]
MLTAIFWILLSLSCISLIISHYLAPLSMSSPDKKPSLKMGPWVKPEPGSGSTSKSRCHTTAPPTMQSLLPFAPARKQFGRNTKSVPPPSASSHKNLGAVAARSSKPASSGTTTQLAVSKRKFGQAITTPKTSPPQAISWDDALDEVEVKAELLDLGDGRSTSDRARGPVETEHAGEKDWTVRKEYLDGKAEKRKRDEDEERQAQKAEADETERRAEQKRRAEKKERAEKQKVEKAQREKKEAEQKPCQVPSVRPAQLPPPAPLRPVNNRQGLIVEVVDKKPDKVVLVTGTTPGRPGWMAVKNENMDELDDDDFDYKAWREKQDEGLTRPYGISVKTPPPGETFPKYEYGYDPESIIAYAPRWDESGKQVEAKSNVLPALPKDQARIVEYMGASKTAPSGPPKPRKRKPSIGSFSSSGGMGIPAVKMLSSPEFGSDEYDTDCYKRLIAEWAAEDAAWPGSNAEVQAGPSSASVPYKNADKPRKHITQPPPLAREPSIDEYGNGTEDDSFIQDLMAVEAADAARRGDPTEWKTWN